MRASLLVFLSSTTFACALDGIGSMPVTVDGGPALEVYGELSVQLDDGTLEMKRPLAFHAKLRNPRFYLGRPTTLAGGLLHLESGAGVRVTKVDGAEVEVTAELAGTTVGGLRLPCAALALDMGKIEPAAPPKAHGKKWQPRSSPFTLTAQPGGGEALAISFDKPPLLIEMASHGRFRRVLMSDDAYGWQIGWIAASALLPAPRDSGSYEGTLFGMNLDKPPPGWFRAPALVSAGTRVFAASGGNGPWATIPAEARFGILGKIGSPWVQLDGHYHSSDGSISLLLSDFDGHAWIPASAIRIQGSVQ